MQRAANTYQARGVNRQKASETDFFLFRFSVR